MNAIAQWDGTTRAASAAFLNLWEKHKQQRSSVWENLCYFLFKKKNWSKNEGRRRRRQSDMHGQATDFGTFSQIQSKLKDRCDFPTPQEIQKGDPYKDSVSSPLNS